MENRRYQTEPRDGYTLYHNENGATLGIAARSVIQKDGYAFKDLEDTGELLPYEDWRLSADERARDLADRLTLEEIAGLMIYSPHQMVPALPDSPFAATYQGKPYPESGAQPWDMTDQQRGLLTNDHVRHVLAMKLQSATVAARWVNNLQRFVEAQPHGIPVAISSDPRHGAGDAAAEYKSSEGQVSRWPEGLGMAATFSPELCEQFGSVIAKEYRALGITTALSPQADLGTEPRWMRVEDTFGACPALVRDMTRAYCDGLQTTPNSPDGWGSGSICAMAKHWPGGGPCEGGRDAHYGFGRYAVYPAGKLADHMQPFLDGAFALNGKTRCVASVMPYYTVSWGIDPSGDQVGNSYSRYLIHGLLREKYGFDGVVCTDWGITGDMDSEIDSFGSRCYGVENLTLAQRHLRIIENGVDQFGGNSDIAPILEAYRLGCKKHGEEAIMRRFRRSAARLLRCMFRCGLFENPYLCPEASAAIVGSETLQRAGYQAQLRAIVMIKNNGALPVQGRKRVYVPERSIKARKGFFRNLEPAKTVAGAPQSALCEFYDTVSSPEQADFALVFIESPLSDGYSKADREAGGNGYLPISLQYRPYTATAARKPSIAGGDPRESFIDRSYRGKTNTAANEADLGLVIDTKKRIGDKPVVVCIRMHNSAVLAELEKYADAILIDFGVEKKALLMIVSGQAEPSGLLPLPLPCDMETVEKHQEDAPLDIEPYEDECGNCYAFGFGLNWAGKIEDERTARYAVK